MVRSSSSTPTGGSTATSWRSASRGEPGRPLSYLAFDLLHLDGRSLLNLALDKRRTLLRGVLRPGDEVVAVPPIASEGRALFEAVTAQGLHGIRARQRSSPYLPGVRSRLWRSVSVDAALAERSPRRSADAGRDVGRAERGRRTARSGCSR